MFSKLNKPRSHRTRTNIKQKSIQQTSIRKKLQKSTSQILSRFPHLNSIPHTRSTSLCLFTTITTKDQGVKNNDEEIQINNTQNETQKVEKANTQKALKDIKPLPIQPEFNFTLFTPAVPVTDKMPIRYCRFMGLNQQSVSIYPKGANGTYQMGPGVLFFVQDLKSNSVRNENDGKHENDEKNDNFLNNPSNIHASNSPESTPTTNPTQLSPLLDHTIPTPPELLERGLVHHLFFTSGGIAVKKNTNLIISTPQLINPNHLCPEKISHFLQFSSKLSNEILKTYTTTSTVNPKAAIEYGLYNDEAYVISLLNDVAIAMNNTAKYLEQKQGLEKH